MGLTTHVHLASRLKKKKSRAIVLALPLFWAIMACSGVNVYLDRDWDPSKSGQLFASRHDKTSHIVSNTTVKTPNLAFNIDILNYLTCENMIKLD